MPRRRGERILESSLLPAGRPPGTREEALRPKAAIIAFLAIAAVAAACGGNDAPGGNGLVVSPVAPTPLPTAVVTSPSNGTGELHGFAYPIAGACLPKGDQLMPNAPRDYRLGVHEGIDLYEADSCVPITRGTPVLAMKAGRVIRADLAYQDPTPATLAAYLANPQTDEALDAFRGRQVWVDHGGGVVTRYVHLSGIAAGITQGMQVTQGQTIAYVGESGTPESVNQPGNEYHLHFEVRVGDTYLGKGLPIEEVRRLYQALFSP